MIRVKNVKLSALYDEYEVKSAVAKAIGGSASDIEKTVIVKRSIDARDKKNVFYLASFDVSICDEERYLGKNNVVKPETFIYDMPPEWKRKTRPVVVGSGPAGLFSALILALRGADPIVIERGECVEKRVDSVRRFWREGKLDPNSNVQFGEGGAGTFSDGKLNTGTRDVRQRKVLEEMVAAGAPGEILYEAKPHIGTDKLIEVVSNIRKKIIALGGEFIFNCEMTDIIIKNSSVAGVSTSKGDIETEAVVLAVGHSARDSFEMIRDKGIPMIRKPFSAGFRIEHLRENIDFAQYGKFAKHLPAADYKCSYVASSGRGVYTFCMCPGGVVVAAASEEGGVVVNGMSNFDRGGKNSNSAILVSLYPEDFEGSDPLSGMYFQRDVERAAFCAGGGDYAAPVSTVGRFLGTSKADFSCVSPSYQPKTKMCDLRKLYPSFISDGVSEAIYDFGRKIKGFDAPSAVLTGVETRSSSPVRILRGEKFSSVIEGLYPCGEGAGYAGGIMSAAVDGIKVGEAVFAL